MGRHPGVLWEFRKGYLQIESFREFYGHLALLMEYEEPGKSESPPFSECERGYLGTPYPTRRRVS